MQARWRVRFGLVVIALLAACGAGSGAVDAPAGHDDDPVPDTAAGSTADPPRNDEDTGAGSTGSGDPTAAVATSDADIQPGLAVHFLDVGQADATLLVHDDATLLIDTGDVRGSQVVAYLDELGIDHLDVVAITHPHADTSASSTRCSPRSRSTRSGCRARSRPA